MTTPNHHTVSERLVQEKSLSENAGEAAVVTKGRRELAISAGAPDGCNTVR